MSQIPKNQEEEKKILPTPPPPKKERTKKEKKDDTKSLMLEASRIRRGIRNEIKYGQKKLEKATGEEKENLEKLMAKMEEGLKRADEIWEKLMWKRWEKLDKGISELRKSLGLEGRGEPKQIRKDKPISKEAKYLEELLGQIFARTEETCSDFGEEEEEET